MAQRKTYLYEVKLSKGQNTLMTKYFYARNVDTLTKFCTAEYYKDTKFDGIAIRKFGQSKIVYKEPVFEFSAKEMEEARKYLYGKQKSILEVNQNASEESSEAGQSSEKS